MHKQTTTKRTKKRHSSQLPNLERNERMAQKKQFQLKSNLHTSLQRTRLQTNRNAKMIETTGHIGLNIGNVIAILVYIFFFLCGAYLFVTAIHKLFKTKKYTKAITYLSIPILIVAFWIWNSLYTFLAIIALTILALLALLVYNFVTGCDHDMKTRLRDYGHYTQCTKCGYGYYRDYPR